MLDLLVEDNNVFARGIVMDYRMEIIDELPGSNPSGSRFEEFEKDSDESAVEEYNQRADELIKASQLRGKWRAHRLVRIDQWEVTTPIPVPSRR